jgi:Flp pilus assembly protein TadD
MGIGATRFWLPALAVAAGAGVGAIVYFSAAWQASRAMDELAAAYSAHRPFELRVPGARFAPLKLTRGPKEPEVVQSLAFLEIRSQVSDNLRAAPEDAEWLKAKGRSELFAGHELDAIHTLRAAADLGGGNSALWNDLGLSYYQLALRNNSADEFTLAVEMFGRAAAAAPADPAIRFNLAMALAQLDLFDAAVENFQRCLHEESDPGWAGEVKSRLRDVEQRRAHLFSLPPGLEGPGTLDDRMERAFTEDIARAFSGDTAVAGSLRTLGEALLRSHDDAWLAEVMKTPASAALREVTATLAAMASIRAKGRFDQYDALAPAIARLQQIHAPQAIASWSDFELLYRASHGGNLQACPASDRLTRNLRALRYHALEIQALLEASTCENGSGKMESAFAAVEAAVGIAEQFHFPSLALRAKGFLVSDYVNQGRYREAYQVSRNGIDEMLREGAPLRRAHQFYHTIERAAERLEHWYVAQAAVDMARRAAGGSGLSVYEMIAECKLAEYSLRLGRRSEADSAYQEALRLYGSLPHTAAVAAYAATAQAGLLEERRDYAGLENLRRAMADVANPYLEAPVDIALARVALDIKRPRDAVEHARRLMNWMEQRAPASEAERWTFRKLLERASTAQTRALLAMDDIAGAHQAWSDFLRADARLLSDHVSAGRETGSDAETARITVADLGTGIAVWMLAGGKPRFAWASPDRQTVVRDLRRLRRLCADPRSPVKLIGELRAAVWHELFGAVMSSGQSRIRRVRVEARGEFNSIPLELLAESDGHDGFAADAAFTPYPLATRSSANSRPVLVAGTEADPKLEMNLPALPGLDDDLAQIAASLHGPEILTGESATPAAVERAAAEARLLHFAGHAIYWREGFALVMAPDQRDPRPDARMGILRITPLTPLTADLAVFSACSTALPEENETLFPSALAEAALLAGTQRVIGSLWDVNSMAASEFDREFYRFLNRTENAAEALRRATAALRADPRFAHPYYWAPFVLYQNN